MSDRFATMLTRERAAEMAALDLWPDRLVSDLLDEAAERDPGRTAVVGHNSLTGTDFTLSYGELYHRSVRLACEFREMGIGRGDVVAVQLPNWWHYAAIYTACVRIGAVINPLMPIFRERELEFMLGFAHAKALVVPREFRSFDYPCMAAALKPGPPALEHVLVVEGGDVPNAFEKRLQRAWEDEIDPGEYFAALRPEPNDVTEIMYTSGTTGQPKGVMHSANTLLCKARLAARSSDRIHVRGSPVDLQRLEMRPAGHLGSARGGRSHRARRCDHYPGLDAFSE